MIDGRLKDSRQRAVGVSAVPPSGQVMSSSAVPPPAQVVSDDELEEQYDRKVNQWTARNIFLIILVSVAARAISEAGWMRHVAAYTVCYGALVLAQYWVRPRPPERFLPWALRVVGVMLNIYIGLVTLPASLQKSLPTPLAYGLPAFLVFISFYWMPPLYPIRGRTPLWKWVIGSVVFAAFWGWVGAYAPT